MAKSNLVNRVGVGLAVAMASAACATERPPEARVWSASSSADGYAGCPSNTTVVGGGHEIVEAFQSPGRIPIVVASKPHGNGWRVICTDAQGVPSAGCKAWSVCASVLK